MHSLYLEHEEIAALGHALNFEAKQSEFLEQSSDDDFFIDGHKRIRRAMLRLASQKIAIDLVSVQTELIKSNELSAAGGASYTADLTSGTHKAFDMRQHLATLRAAATKRSLITKLERALAGAIGGETSDDIIASLELDITELQSGHEVEVSPVRNFISAELDAISRERTATTTLQGIPTGIGSLDFVTTGWRTEFTLVGGWPARGKSIFLLQAARAAAMAGYPTLIISLEMRKGELLRRLMVAESRLRARKFRDAREMSDSDYAHLVQSSESLAELPIYVCDQDSLDPRQITATVKLWIRKAGIRIVFVDFLQIVRESGRDAREITNKISAALRSLSKNSQIAVVAASQLSRANARNLNERPTLFHLKESGNLEQDAHNVLFIYRPVDERQEFTGDDEIIIAKQRHGVTGSIPVFCNGNLYFFEERKEL